MSSPRIGLIEDYVRYARPGEVAHGYKHVDRVRGWALKIADSVGYANHDIVEATALLHDVGLTQAERKEHASVGAEIAARYLSERELFSISEIAAIAHAIGSHNSLGDCSTLASILRDADILDLLGAVGIMRAFTSKYFLEDYDRTNVKGETWGNTSQDTTRRLQSGAGIGPTILDQINFQISCHGNLWSEFARNKAGPLVTYMRDFMLELETEVSQG